MGCLRVQCSSQIEVKSFKVGIRRTFVFEEVLVARLAAMILVDVVVVFEMLQLCNSRNLRTTDLRTRDVSAECSNSSCKQNCMSSC